MIDECFFFFVRVKRKEKKEANVCTERQVIVDGDCNYPDSVIGAAPSALPLADIAF